MKKSELWAIYIKKYPQFAQEGEITLTTKGLRKMFDTTWDTAYHDGESEEEDYLDPECKDAVEALGKIFGFR